MIKKKIPKVVFPKSKSVRNTKVLVRRETTGWGFIDQLDKASNFSPQNQYKAVTINSPHANSKKSLNEDMQYDLSRSPSQNGPN